MTCSVHGVGSAILGGGCLGCEADARAKRKLLTDAFFDEVEALLELEYDVWRAAVNTMTVREFLERVERRRDSRL
jgi:hypothetical protein